MSDILSEVQGHVLLITLNRMSKHNAFDDTDDDDFLFDNKPDTIGLDTRSQNYNVYREYSSTSVLQSTPH